MKRSIVFSFLLVVLTSSVFATTTEISLFKDQIPPGPKPLSLTFLPVSATISETELSVYFDSPVGNATITVYDAYDNVVSQETVDTYSTSEVFIVADTWASGNYTLKVSYRTTTLSGIFLVE
jgi:hypothetical protein